MKKKIIIWIILSLCLCLTGCQQQVEVEEWQPLQEEQTEKETLIIYSPHSSDFIWPIIQAFELENEINVEVISAGTGDLLDRIEEEKDKPQADLIWGGTVTLLDSNKDLFQAYYSQNESSIIEEYRNKTGEVTSFTLVPSVLIVNTELCKDINVEGYEDLLDEKLKGKIAHCNPEKSSSAYEQVINILNAMGNGNPEDGWPYMEKLMKNLDGQLFTSSSDVYNSVVEGKNSVGLTYEEGAVKNMLEGAPVKVVYMKEGVICRADGAAIIKDAPHLASAKKFIDFITSKEAQEIAAEKLNRRPIREDVKLNEGILPYSEINILTDDVTWANENKERILEKCSEYINEYSLN